MSAAQKQSAAAPVTFSVNLPRAHVDGIILDRPLQIFFQVIGPDAAERAAQLEEFYTEGRNRRTPSRHDPRD